MKLYKICYTSEGSWTPEVVVSETDLANFIVECACNPGTSFRVDYVGVLVAPKAEK